MVADKFTAIFGILVIGAATAVVYVVLLAMLRAPELRAGVAAVRGRLGRFGG